MSTEHHPRRVPDLIARVSKSTANIQRHRDAMATVARQAAANAAPPPPPKEAVK